MAADQTYSDLVRALEAISSHHQANDIAVEKVGSTVEYFRALVEAQKESSRKQSESDFARTELESQHNMAEPTSGEGNNSWLPMIASDELLNMLKSAQTYASSNLSETEVHWGSMGHRISNLTSIFGFSNGTDEDEAILNGTFRFGIDLNSGLTNLSNLKDILGTFKQNLDESSKLSEYVIYSLITIYSILIVFGILGNILILWAVLGREAMRTARNVFIGTLAASDLFLCIFTMPSTLWEVRTSYFHRFNKYQLSH
jgi:hypothetical protein